MKKFSIIFRLVAAAIMLQTLYFKFSGHEESVALFTKLGAEPFGRIGIGIFELIASVLILFPKTVIYGAGLGLGLMAGAIMGHLTVLGIESNGDGGQLFVLACVTAICCLLTIIAYKKELLDLKNFALGLIKRKVA